MTFSAGSKIFSAVLLASAGYAAVAPGALAQQPAAAPVTAPRVTGLPDFTDLIERVSPAVVNIRTSNKLPQRQPGSSDEMEELLRRYFGIVPQPRGGAPRRPGGPQGEDQQVQRGVGSGFIISADGYVLTNAHVVEGADEVTLTLVDRREFKAKVLGADKRTDVAVLKVEATGLPFLKIGDSNRIRVGEWVLAIGSPFNLDNTVTAGIISAKARDTGEYLPLIQSDVAVNPGNSGGPMINMRGEVVGINSQILSPVGVFNGVSFAVPIDEAMRVADQLKKSGKVTRGRIGVQIGEVSKDVAESLGLGSRRGVEVTSVTASGPAEKAGIKVGDIILKFNGQPVEKTNDLQRLVGGTTVGSRAMVTVWRKGAQQDVAVTVDQLEEDRAKGGAGTTNALGLAVSSLGDTQKRELRVDGGVVVDAAEGAAQAAGLQEGDIILQINNVDVRDAAQFNGVVAKLDLKRPVPVLVVRGGVSAYVLIRPPRK